MICDKVITNVFGTLFLVMFWEMIESLKLSMTKNVIDIDLLSKPLGRWHKRYLLKFYLITPWWPSKLSVIQQQQEAKKLLYLFLRWFSRIHIKVCYSNQCSLHKSLDVKLLLECHTIYLDCLIKNLTTSSENKESSRKTAQWLP